MITDLRAAFDRFRFSAFRLETLQEYQSPDEAAAFAAFLAGRPPVIDTAKAEYLRVVRAAARDGRTMQRVHIVTEPLTDYLRFEIGWSYRQNAAAGEDIRIITVTPDDPWPAQVPARDFVLFDNAELWIPRYVNAILSNVTRDTDPADVAAACQRKEAALHLGVPWAAYAQSHDLAHAS